MARVVGPTGRVIGIERDEGALASARQLVRDAGCDNVELRSGTALESGLSTGSIDVAVMRHVLAHNGPDEQQIVDHLAHLVRPGGSMYLVDADGTAMRTLGADPDLSDLTEKYVELHRQRGNDLQVGLRLGQLLSNAGLQLIVHEGRYQILTPPSGVRPAPWAAREAMVANGIASNEDVQRWDAALERTDAAELRPTLFIPTFFAIGFKPS
jgi:SAM-dependent methyltransferase